MVFSVGGIGAILRGCGRNFVVADGALSARDLSGVLAGAGGEIAAEDAGYACCIWGIGRVGQHCRTWSFIARSAAGYLRIRAGAASTGGIAGAEGAGGSQTVGDSGGDAGRGIGRQDGGAHAVEGTAAGAGADCVPR